MVIWGEKHGGGGGVMPKGERAENREEREKEGGDVEDSEREGAQRRDWSLLIFTISAPDNLWPKWRFDTNRPWRLTCSEAAKFRSHRACAAAQTRWTRTGDIQASKLPEKLRHGFSALWEEHKRREKKRAVILCALGSRGRLIWLKMKREGQRQRRVEWGSQGKCLGEEDEKIWAE